MKWNVELRCIKLPVLAGPRGPDMRSLVVLLTPVSYNSFHMNRVDFLRHCLIWRVKKRALLHRTVASSSEVVQPYCIVISTTPTSLVQVHKYGMAMAAPAPYVG